MKRQLCSAPTILTVGPLHMHFVSFGESLAGQGYSSYTIDQKLRLLVELDRWFLQRRLRIEDFSEKHIQKFLRYFTILSQKPERGEDHFVRSYQTRR